MLDQCGVALTPGSGFGPAGRTGYAWPWCDGRRVGGAVDRMAGWCDGSATNGCVPVWSAHAEPWPRGVLGWQLRSVGLLQHEFWRLLQPRHRTVHPRAGWRPIRRMPPDNAAKSGHRLGAGCGSVRHCPGLLMQATALAWLGSRLPWPWRNRWSRSGPRFRSNGPMTFWLVAANWLGCCRGLWCEVRRSTWCGLDLVA